MAAIYGLYAPDGELIYIGKANNPAKRLSSHSRDASRRHTPLYNWMRKHGAPEMRVLVSDCADWRDDERRLIAEARARGECRLNVADGGDEPHCPTEVRAANGKRAADARPPNVMRVYRTMEYLIRMAAKHFPHKVPKYRETHGKFKACVESHRFSGTLDYLDAHCAKLFENKPVERWT